MDNRAERMPRRDVHDLTAGLVPGMYFDDEDMMRVAEMARATRKLAVARNAQSFAERQSSRLASLVLVELEYSSLVVLFWDGG